MHTLLLIVLLISAMAVAFLDLRELFLIWYSETSPLVSTGTVSIVVLQILLCMAIVVVVSLRLYLDC